MHFFSLRTHQFLSVSALVLILGCKPRTFNSSSEQSLTQQKVPVVRFCEAENSKSDLWSAERVQQEIIRLIDEPGHSNSGLSVYSEVYLAMTRERDAARCDPKNSMYPKEELPRRLNDALADMMTKGLIAGQRGCLKSFANPQLTVPTIGQQLCELNHTAIQEKWSELELALGSTAVYLTSVMGLALSALPHADQLWVNTPHKTIPARLEYMRSSFKPVYDSFNLFLSNNLHTVADVLVKQNRINCKLFKTAAKAAEITRAPTLIFQNIRDKTFSIGLELANSWPRGLHPYTAGELTWNVEKVFGAFAKEPRALVELHGHAVGAVGTLRNPLFKIFKGRDAESYVSGEGLTCPIKIKP